jgi:hypothetical protein
MQRRERSSMRAMTMIAVEDDFLVEHLSEMPDDGTAASWSTGYCS